MTAVVPGRVSVVVPTRDSGRTIAACIESARRQSGADVEIVVVDNDSSDDTVALAAGQADVVLSCGPERSAQRNAGAAAATGEWLLFIDSDQILTEHVAAQVAAVLGSRRDVGALVVPELSFGDGFVATCRAFEKRLYLGDADAEAARAFPRAVFDDVGGYDAALTGTEDYDLPDRIRAAGWSIGRIEAFVWHDEGHQRLREVFRKKRYYGAGVAQQLRARPGLARRRLRRSGLGGLRSHLLRAPHLVAALLLLKAVDAAGLALGALAGPARAR